MLQRLLEYRKKVWMITIVNSGLLNNTDLISKAIGMKKLGFFEDLLNNIEINRNLPIMSTKNFQNH
jgi:hypothetical protein